MFKTMQKLVCILVVWNVLITGILVGMYAKHRADKLSELICIQEEIPNEEIEFDIVEGL